MQSVYTALASSIDYAQVDIYTKQTKGERLPVLDCRA